MKRFDRVVNYFKKIFSIILKVVVCLQAIAMTFMGMTYFLMLDPKNQWVQFIQDIPKDKLFLTPLAMFVVGMTCIILIVVNAFYGRKLIDEG